MEKAITWEELHEARVKAAMGLTLEEAMSPGGSDLAVVRRMERIFRERERVV